MKSTHGLGLLALVFCIACEPTSTDSSGPDMASTTPNQDGGAADGGAGDATPRDPSPDDAALIADGDVPRASDSTMDGQPPASDAMSAVDSAPPEDAAAPVMDANPPVVDANPPVVDAAPPPPDMIVPRPDAALDPCEGLLACQGFEGLAPGAADDVPGWAVVTPNCSGEGRITIEDDRPHSGERVMHVTGPGGYCNHVFLGLEAPLELGDAVLHVRFYMRVARPLGFGHITFLAMEDSQTERDLRMGGQSEILMWNREIDDATLPELSPTGIDHSFAPVSNQWHCLEFAVDGAAGTLSTWVDGALVDGLVVDAEPTADIDGQWHRRENWHPQIEDFRIGWESYGGDAADVWFDDIAVGTRPIGCL